MAESQGKVNRARPAAARKTAKGRKSRGSVLDFREIPSPPARARCSGVLDVRSAGAAHPASNDGSASGAVLAEGPPEKSEAVLSLAASGLTLVEIFAELGLSDPEDEDERRRLEEIVQRGRSLGIAALKQAQYRAALEGRVTAQAQMLELLGANSADPLAVEPVTVTRHILDAPGHAED